MSQEPSKPSSLWLPRAPALHLIPTLEAEIVAPRAGLSGHFTVELVHAATGDVRRRLQFDNLITNTGLDLPGTGVTPYLATTHLAVGDKIGPAEPTVANFKLEQEIFRTSRDAGENAGISPAGDYWWFRKTKEFIEGEANGNLTELGFFNGAGDGAVMWNRQLFRDANNQPTVVTKTSFDKLRVTYEWRMYPPPNPAANRTETITISGVTHQMVTATHNADYAFSWGYTASPPYASGLLYNLGVWSGAVAVWEQNAVPTYAGEMPPGPRGGTGTFAAYASGTRYREAEFVFPPEFGNFASGIGMIGSLKTNEYAGSSSTPFVHCFEPKIQKTDTKRLTVRLRLGWGRQGE